MSFPVVAIVASAGGLEALSELLGELPPDSGVALIVVQHLDPDHQSLLADILGRRTPIPVSPAENGVQLEPNRVYVISPNSALTVKDDRLHIGPRSQGRDRHKPGDVLFRSLAENRPDSAIGVVLSGGDSDGALGIQAIKEAGGITFAQDPESARFPSMPVSAIETGCVDFVLRPNAIAQELARLGHHPYLEFSASEQSDAQALLRSPDEEETLRRVFRHLRAAHGADFAMYKRSTLQRRLARRMAVRRIDAMSDYATLIESDAGETAALYQDFLIRVTAFFRDPETFEALVQQVFPRLSEGHSEKQRIRIWVPGCASGEEVYSIAMLLVEFLGERRSAVGVQIFGTDVSETAIEKARAGVYPESIHEDVPPERLNRYFVKQGSHYCVAKSIRDMCIFARHDVTRDPPFSRLDLVSCRNLLIYLDAPAQRRVMQVFHYALRPQGFLLLGTSESVGQASDWFEMNDRTHRIYTRKATGAGATFGFTDSRSGSGPYERSSKSTAVAPIEAAATDSIHREAQRLLLARYAPVGVLVDENFNVLHFQGETGRYLEHLSGPPSLNLRRLARPQLLMELDTLLKEVRDSGAEARSSGLTVDGLRDVTLQIIPLQRLTDERAFLILFEDGARQSVDRRPPPVVPADLSESEKDLRLVQMEREVVAMREYVQSTIEEHDAVKEELKSAHEEVLSANEEFQSTNEELETSKEELQSANEELTTTNEELRNRNGELAVVNAELERMRSTAEHARAYADEIIETVRDPLVVLNGDLEVLRANQAFYAKFNMRRESTEGFALYQLETHQWDTAALRKGLEEVLTRSEPLNNWEVRYQLADVGHRLLLLNARRIAGDTDRDQLILLAIEDITERRANTESLRESGRRKDEFLAMLAHELRNPLSALAHTIHILRQGDPEPTAMKRYDLMARQMTRLVRLVDELLDVARISRGLIELKREVVDLNSIARDAINAATARIEQNGHALSLMLPDKRVEVSGDSVRLEQVISNLIENAAKYTPEGGRIAIALSEESGLAVLRVRDNGVGLKPEMVERIFDLFTQADNTLARSGGGLGLGLTLVRRVLELHGGTVQAYSSGLGQGSEFTVRLPLHTVNDTNVVPAVERSSEAPPVQRRRVLIVDDNADAAESMEAVVSMWGHTVATAPDGLAALSLVESFKPDTALVDIGLPGMDGYELARRLRALPETENVELLAMTGYGRPEDRQSARAAGFDLHLVKPTDLTELEKLLAGASLRRK